MVEKAKTIAEAEQRASRLKQKLENINVHSAIFEYCKAKLLVENYFHSVFEATKSIADRLRTMTGLYADGNTLAETSFSTSNPLVKINHLRTDTDRSKHLGLCNLITRIFGFIENQGYMSDFYSDAIVRDGATYLIHNDLQVDAFISTSLKNTPSILYKDIGFS